MQSWWQLGEGFGQAGSSLALYQIECAFCGERDNWAIEHRAEKRKPNSRKVLYFDTYKCGNCAGYVMVFWSASESSGGPMGGGLHAYRVLPWPLDIDDGEEYWPATVKRFWKQAHTALSREDFDAATVMSRSALQAVTRSQSAEGNDLYGEIEDLESKGIIPKIIKDWAHEVRLLARPSAHPETDEADVDPNDARDIVQFLDYLLEYVYGLPHRIEEYRSRRAPEQSSDEE